MTSTKDLCLCNYCLQLHPNENIRQVKLRAVEFIRDYLNPRLIKLNRICLNCIDSHVRTISYQSNRALILNAKSLDIDYTSDSAELNLTLQYIDQYHMPSVRITSRFLSITTVEQVMNYLIQTFDLSLTENNLRLTMIRRENNEIWKPILYDRSTTMYQLDVKSNSYLRFEFSLREIKIDLK